MLKRILALPLILAGQSVLANCDESMFAGGAGSNEDPWQVATAFHLNNVRECSSDHFIQTANLDLDISPFNEGAGWHPIPQLLGRYDGQGFVIANLFIDRPTSREQAMIVAVEASGEVRDLAFLNPNVAGEADVAPLAVSSQGLISRVAVIGGGLSGATDVAGLVAFNVNGGVIEDSFTRTMVSGSGSAAGFASINGGIIRRCYSASEINSDSDRGGLVDVQISPTGVVTDSFWDLGVAGVTVSAGGTGKTTVEMKSIETFTNTATDGLDEAWDFADTWGIDPHINQGYPRLRNNQPTLVTDEIFRSQFISLP
jgi:trimeric autotransporter adhesin